MYENCVPKNLTLFILFVTHFLIRSNECQQNKAGYTPQDRLDFLTTITRRNERRRYGTTDGQTDGRTNFLIQMRRAHLETARTYPRLLPGRPRRLRSQPRWVHVSTTRICVAASNAAANDDDGVAAADVVFRRVGRGLHVANLIHHSRDPRARRGTRRGRASTKKKGR